MFYFMADILTKMKLQKHYGYGFNIYIVTSIRLMVFWKQKFWSLVRHAYIKYVELLYAVAF